MTNKGLWMSHAQGISLLCQIFSQEDRPSFVDKLASIEGVEIKPSSRSVWTYFSINKDGREISGALYIRRLILFVPASFDKDIPLSELLVWALETKNFLSTLATNIAGYLCANSDSRVTYFSVVHCDAINRRWPASTSYISGLPAWIDDGASTFNLRAFDSRNNQYGIIRVSRHLMVLYGITPGLTTDIINLAFENLLYSKWPITKDEVFAFLDALGKYVLPTEVSLFTHRFASRLAAFAVVVGGLFSLFSSILGALPSEFSISLRVCVGSVLFVGVGLLSYFAWLGIGWAMSRLMDY